MKLILASQGFTTEEMANEVAKIVEKPASEINIAIINETACELAAEKRVVMGTSAGSIVLGKQIISPKFWKERYNTKIENYEYQELGLVDFNIIPHFLRKDHEKWTSEFLKDVLSDNPFTIYAVTDEQAVAYVNGEIKFIGGKPEIFGKDN